MAKHLDGGRVSCPFLPRFRWTNPPFSRACWTPCSWKHQRDEPQMALVDAVLPGATGTVAEAGNESDGRRWLSRVPDGGEPLDQAFVMQALSPEPPTCFHASWEGRRAEQPAADVLHGFGPNHCGIHPHVRLGERVADVGGDRRLHRRVVEHVRGARSPRVGDGTFEVHAISHSLPLLGLTTSHRNRTAGGCVSVRGQWCWWGDVRNSVVRRGHGVDGRGLPDEEVCLTAEDGALVTLGTSATRWRVSTRSSSATKETPFWPRRKRRFSTSPLVRQAPTTCGV